MVTLGNGQFFSTTHRPLRMRGDFLVLLTAFATASAAHRTAIPVTGAVKEASTSTAEETYPRMVHAGTRTAGFSSWLVSYAIVVGCC